MLDFPCDKGISKGEFDGVTNVIGAQYPVPEGLGFWELTTQASSISAKADRDYSKRTEKTSEDTRMQSTYIAATPLPWEDACNWCLEKKRRREWAEIVVINRDGILSWIESNPRVLLNVVVKFFPRFMDQSIRTSEAVLYEYQESKYPSIDKDRIVQDRNDKISLIQEWWVSDREGPLVINANSKHEAISFYHIAIENLYDELSRISFIINNQNLWYNIVSSNGHKETVLIPFYDNFFHSYEANNNGYSLVVPIEDSSFQPNKELYVNLLERI